MATQNLPQNVVLTQTLQSTIFKKILPPGTRGRILDRTDFNDYIVLFEGLPTVFIFTQYDNRIAQVVTQGVSDA